MQKNALGMNKIDKSIQLFLWSAGGLLLVVALIRFMITADESQILVMPDPLLGIPVRYAVVGIGVAELVIGLFCLFGKSIGTRTALLAWLMTNWLGYQAGLIYTGISDRCTCSGILTNPLHLSNGWCFQIAKLLPPILFIGAYAAMILVWVGQKRQDKRTYLKIACPGCGDHIEFMLPVHSTNLKIACPHCGGGVRPKFLPKIA
jgi:hypothetical protein